MQATSNAGIGTGKCIEFQNQKRFSSASRRRLGEERVVRVHLLPALAAGRRLDLVRARERARLGRRGHGPVYNTSRCAPSGSTTLGGPEVLGRRGRPAARAGADRGARPRRRGGRQSGRLEGARARRLPRRAAVHGRLGRRRRRRGGRGRRDLARARRPRLRHAALPAGGGLLRGVRRLAVAAAGADPRGAGRRRGGGASRSPG